MKRLPFFLVAVSILSGCSIYRPQSVDIPLLEQAGETRIDAAVGASAVVVLPDAFTLNATGSHAFTDHIAGQVHANVGTGVYYLQAAPGVYTRLGSKGRLEGYAGLGFGGSMAQAGETGSRRYDYDGHYGLVFAQGNIGWRHLGPLEVGFGLKLGALLPRFDYYEFHDEENPAAVTAHEQYSTGNFLLEPQLQLRLGSDEVKFTTRLGFCWLSDLDGDGAYFSSSDHFVHDMFTLSIGLCFTL